MKKEYARYKAGKYLEWAEKAEAKAKQLSDHFHSDYKDFDWTEPIKIGHHSQRRHERVFEAKDRFFLTQIELENKAKGFREKAANLTEFANRNKGDAERRREAIRQKQDALIAIGTRVHDFCFGSGTVRRVNKKTYTIKFDTDSMFTRDKTFVEIIQ